MMRANLWLRTASRVLVRVARFNAKAFHELESRAKRLPWHEYLSHGASADFRVTTHKSRLYHSDAIAERLAEAVARQTSTIKRPASDVERTTLNVGRGASQLFVVRVVRDEFTISADTSGDLLHMRGYRQAIGKAPLRETLAAALILACEWNGDRPLLDPFCGSGTIPIEAALLARNQAPGMRRPFAFMQWPKFHEPAWRALLRDAKTRALARSAAPIVASDRDAGAVESALANADRAGVAADLSFSSRAISAIEPQKGPGLVATNPPYGKRVGGEGSADVRNLYAQFGKVLRARCAGWRVAFYSADPLLPKQTGLACKELFRTSNGGIGVTALVADIPQVAAGTK